MAKIYSIRKQVNVNIILDKRSQKCDGTYPVKLIVYYGQTNKRYSFDRNISLLDSDFEKMLAPRLKQKELLEIKTYLEAEKARAQKYADQLGEEFTYELFEALYKDRQIVRAARTQKQKIYTLFEEHIANLNAADAIGSASAYSTAMRSFQTFAPNLAIKDITPQFLYKYEKWVTDSGRSITTAAIYLRALRTIVNIAKDRGLITHTNYPFGAASKKKYEIPEGRNIKKALVKEEIQKIRDTEDLTDEARYARDMWLFSFYCNGMNMADIYRLRYEDIADGFIHFIRTKTQRTQKDKTPIEVYLSDPAREIIERWGVKPVTPQQYIFPVLNDLMTSEDKFRITHNATRSVNQYMATLSRRLGLSVKVTTYTARHSYATLLKNMGTSIEEIAENLGHSNITTTKSYLASFPQEHKKETAEKLVALL